MRDFMGLSGLEPLTSRLSGVRSNQLSYRPEPKVDPVSTQSFKIREQLIWEEDDLGMLLPFLEV